MARKTKDEALATRSSILDAAEQLFELQGVSRTSLQDIASAAGVTRGAIYWHFENKSDVVNAMLDRVCLPMEEAQAALEPGNGSPVIPALRAQLQGVLTRVTCDAQARRVFDIATHKVEYIDEMCAVRARHLQIRREYLVVLERTLRRGQRRGELAASPPARQAAIGLQALLSGLIHNWMLDPALFDLRTVGRRAIEAYLAGLVRR